MRVFELRYPGTWLDGLDPDLSHSTQSLLHVLDSHIADAAVGLALFDEAHNIEHRPTFGGHDRYEHVSALQAVLEAELPPDLTPEERWQQQSEIREIVDTRVRRAEWHAGRTPNGYTFRLPFIHAHTVLYALDGVSKALGVLKKTKGLPLGVGGAADEFATSLPSVVEIRNSAHHVEDRARQQNKGGKKIDLKPVQNSMIQAPGGGALILSSLNNNRLGYTLDDGYYGEVEISEASVAAAQSAVQRALDSFSWRGPSRTVPD
jgi:hypothetical protein